MTFFRHLKKSIFGCFFFRFVGALGLKTLPSLVTNTTLISRQARQQNISTVLSIGSLSPGSAGGMHYVFAPRPCPPRAQDYYPRRIPRSVLSIVLDTAVQMEALPDESVDDTVPSMSEPPVTPPHEGPSPGNMAVDVDEDEVSHEGVSPQGPSPGNLAVDADGDEATHEGVSPQAPPPGNQAITNDDDGFVIDLTRGGSSSSSRESQLICWPLVGIVSTQRNSCTDSFSNQPFLSSTRVDDPSQPVRPCVLRVARAQTSRRRNFRGFLPKATSAKEAPAGRASSVSKR